MATASPDPVLDYERARVRKRLVGDGAPFDALTVVALGMTALAWLIVIWDVAAAGGTDSVAALRPLLIAFILQGSGVICALVSVALTRTVTTALIFLGMLAGCVLFLKWVVHVVPVG